MTRVLGWIGYIALGRVAAAAGGGSFGLATFGYCVLIVAGLTLIDIAKEPR